MSVSKVGVVGCGLMGSGIAEVCARAGIDTVVVEEDPAALEAGRRRVERSLGRGVSSGKLTEERRREVGAAIAYTVDYERLGDRELVVEAVHEDERLKFDVFRRIDGLLQSQDAVIASNTSSVPIMKIAMATARPDRVIGLHFFNPVPVLRLVELVPSLLTSEETVRVVEDFAIGQLGKRSILCKDRAGFVVNALLIPYLLSAIRMLESGFASAEDIDTGMIEGCAHPMGPLALADLIGLDTTSAVAQSLYEEFKEPLFAAPPLLNRMVEAGLLGRKSGRGFYTYAG
ncbi:MAG TPA: 3-hydroxybutyryl-CoA dehydrogenase [Candidatus Dormibacteraeota bacterium]